MTTDLHTEDLHRLEAIYRELPRAFYPVQDLDRAHALEDEAATILGRRTVRQASDVISGAELYRLMGRTLTAARRAEDGDAPRP